MTVSSVGTPTLTAATASASMSQASAWGTGQTRTGGNLLVAAVTAYGTTTVTLGAIPSGWSLMSTVVGGTNQTITAYYARKATGSDTAPTFAATTTGTAVDSSLEMVLFEFTDPAGTPIITTDGINIGTTLTIAATTVLAVPVAGCVGLSATKCANGTTAATTTWTAGSGFTLSATTPTGSSLQSQMATALTTSAPSSGSALAHTWTHSRTSATQSAITLVIAPPGNQPGLFLDSVGPGTASRDPGIASGSAAGNTASKTLSWTHTIIGDPWGNNSMVLCVGVAVGASPDTGFSITGVTVGGVAMTAAGAIVHSGGDTVGFAQAWRLADPTGTILGPGAHTIVVTVGSGTPLSIAAGSTAWNGADQNAVTGTVFTNHGPLTDSSPATVTLTSTTAGRQIFGVVADGSGDANPGPTFPAVRRWQDLAASSSAAGAVEGVSAYSTGSSQTLSVAIAVDEWAFIAFEIIAAATPPAKRSLVVPQAVKRAAFY